VTYHTPPLSQCLQAPWNIDKLAPTFQDINPAVKYNVGVTNQTVFLWTTNAYIIVSPAKNFGENFSQTVNHYIRSMEGTMTWWPPNPQSTLAHTVVYNQHINLTRGGTPHTSHFSSIAAHTATPLGQALLSCRLWRHITKVTLWWSSCSVSM